MKSIQMPKFRSTFMAPLGKFRLIAISDNFLEEEPEIRDFQSLEKAKDAADRKSESGKTAEVYDDKGEFVYRGRVMRR